MGATLLYLPRSSICTSILVLVPMHSSLDAFYKGLYFRPTVKVKGRGKDLGF